MCVGKDEIYMDNNVYLPVVQKAQLIAKTMKVHVEEQTCVSTQCHICSKLEQILPGVYVLHMCNHCPAKV